MDHADLESKIIIIDEQTNILEGFKIVFEDVGLSVITKLFIEEEPAITCIDGLLE